MEFNNLFINFFIYLSFFFRTVQLDKILGCNGVIKSDIPIDFSKVEVKL